MRKIILSVYLSLDGFMAGPNGDMAWTMPYWSDEASKYAYDQLFASDALLLGRVTYEGFAKAWPTMTDEEGFAKRINALPKFVASRTMENAAWNATVLSGDVVEEVTRLKARPGENLLIYGSGDFTQTLMRHNLIDEYRLWVHPVVLGSGQRLFDETTQAPALMLAGTTTFGSGVVVLSYQPV